LRVISFGIYSKRPEYPRHRNLIQGLEEHGVEVVECHEPMAQDLETRLRAARSPIGMLIFGFSLLRTWVRLAGRFRRLAPADAVLVGYPGLFHLHLARWLARRRMPHAVIVLDVFAPVFETVIHDRKLLREGSAPARVLRRAESSACRRADVCLIDTEAHADYLAEELGVPRERCASTPAGPTFPPFDSPAPVKETNTLSVLFVGTYIPLHGLDTIVGAAELLRGRPEVRFHFVGSGQLRPTIEAQAVAAGLENVEFRDWLPASEVGDLVRSHDVALGVFGETVKAAQVMPYKVIEACAAGVPLITADTPGVRPALRHRENAWLVPAGDAQALSEALLELARSPGLRERLAAEALRTAHELFSPWRMGKDLIEAITAGRAATRSR
jgi:glycosyltransferase involved in cell wall biosynthesis